MSDLEELRKRHTEKEPGPCRVCGGALGVVASDYAETVWACVDGSVRPDGLQDFDHYGRSRRKIPAGDPRVIALIDEVEALRRTVRLCEACNGDGIMMVPSGFHEDGPGDEIPETCGECHGTCISSWGQALDEAEVLRAEVEALRGKVAQHELEALGRSPFAGARDAKVELEAWRRDVTDGHPVLPEVGGRPPTLAEIRAINAGEAGLGSWSRDSSDAQPVSPAFELDAVGAVERVTGLKWDDSEVGVGTLDDSDHPCVHVGYDFWWIIDAMGSDVAEGSQVGDAGKRAASLALLKAIHDGRVTLPEGAPGLGALTVEERRALGVEG